MLQTLDNYGLGLSLLVLLKQLTITPSKAMDDTHELLKSMCDFDVSKRPTPDKAVDTMTNILRYSGGRRMRRKTHRKTHRNRTTKKKRAAYKN